MYTRELKTMLFINVICFFRKLPILNVCYKITNLDFSDYLTHQFWSVVTCGLRHTNCKSLDCCSWLQWVHISKSTNTILMKLRLFSKLKNTWFKLLEETSLKTRRKRHMFLSKSIAAQARRFSQCFKVFHAKI